LASLAGEVTSGATPQSGSSRYYAEFDGLPFAKIDDLTAATSRFLGGAGLHITPAALRETALRVYPTGTILLSMYGTVGLVKTTTTEMVANQALAAILPPFGCDPDYLAHCLQWSRPRWDRHKAQTTQANINGRTVKRFQVALPPRPEQRRIAEILDTIDDAIRRTEQVIAKLQQMKQGLIHDLLTRGIDENGELRDPERCPEQFGESPLGVLPNDWKTRLLGQAVRGHRGVTYRPEHLLDRHDVRGIVLLRATNIQDTSLDLADVQVVSRAIVKEEQVAVPGDILVCMSNGSRRLVGKSAQVETTLEEPLTIGAFCSAFRPFEGNQLFIRMLFLSRWYQRAVDLALAGSAINNLTPSQVLATMVPWPTPAEQERLADRFGALEQRLAAERGSLSKLRLIKQGLMNDLLTGCVRVSTLEAVPS